MKDEARVRALLEDRFRAMTAKDVGGSLQPLAPHVVNFDLAPPLAQIGAEATDPKAMSEWFATWEGPIGLELSNLTIRAAGGIAFCHGLVHMSGKRTDGEHTDVWARSTVCLEKSKDGWQIVHEHTSFPMLMDGSDKAATNLKP